MIVSRLMGGLGNQMFQYATGRALALRNNTTFELDTTWFKGEGLNAETPRSYELDCFTITTEFTKPDNLPSLRASRSQRLLHKLQYGTSPLTVLNEPDQTFHQSAYDAPDNTYLVGYWQNERYFKDVADTIRNDFSFTPEATGKNAELLEEITNTMAVSLHVRRGDYVTGAAASQVHGYSMDDYYKSAVAAITKEFGDVRFYVFSDEPEWCKENLAFEQPVTFVDHNPPDKGFEDMRLMMACKHHIIANSSFSWWGAWLNPSPTKVVYAPKQWYKDPNQVTEIVPDSWHKL